VRTDHGSAPASPPPQDSLPGSAALCLLPRLPYSSVAVCGFARSKAAVALSWRHSSAARAGAAAGYSKARERWGKLGNEFAMERRAANGGPHVRDTTVTCCIGLLVSKKLRVNITSL
jgi:hypothetical protein